MTLDTKLACLRSNILYLGSERGEKESITARLLLKGTIRVVDICITLQNAEKIRKEREKGVSSQKTQQREQLEPGAEANLMAPILFSMIIAGGCSSIASSSCDY